MVPPGGAHLSVSPGPPQTQRVPSPQVRFSSQNFRDIYNAKGEKPLRKNEN